MGFDQEWAALREQAIARQESDTRLNQLPGDPSGPTGPGGPADFGSTPAMKKAAANEIANRIKGDTKLATEKADEASESAIKGFDGWQTDAGLKKVQETWDKQVNALMGRLAHEENSLRGTNGYFTENDLGINSMFGTLPKSKLEGFK
ncbi:hypothetical protein ACPCSP_21755 [Streptomyces cinereoruber]|uniref:hypothetical protein n=1 Tax=Streptomyces cinereoruber TaxID=67260 RepID=UPI003C2D4054